MNIFGDVIAKAIVMIVIYLIISNALDNLRFRTKALIIFFIGIVMGGIFYLAYYYDLQSDTMENQYTYFTLIGVNALTALYFLITTFTKYRRNEFDKYRTKTKRVEPTSKVHYREFLYLVFEYKNEYLLKKHKEHYSGLNIRLKKGSFHDEEINSLLRKYDSMYAKVKLYGEYVDNKKKEIYYAYLINLNKAFDMKKFEWFNFSKIRFLEMHDFDKELIYRLLIKEKFNIEK